MRNTIPSLCPLMRSYGFTSSCWWLSSTWVSGMTVVAGAVGKRNGVSDRPGS